jgi:hypothetical protein
MTALTQRELAAARPMIWAGLATTVVRWSIWAMTTERPWYVRALAGALIGAFLLAAVPAAFNWIEAQSKAKSMEEKSRPNDKAPSSSTIHIYNAPVTQITQILPSANKLDQMTDDKKPSPHISIQTAPGSIIAPSGGNNTITNNFGPQPRQLDSPWGTPLTALLACLCHCQRISVRLSRAFEDNL